MELTTDLIKQFVDVTNDSKTTNESKTTHRATAVVNNKGIFVKLDGSDPDVLTPVSMATDARDGDRVLVTIENHHADIVGNITSPGSGRSASDLYSKEVQEDGTIVVKGELRVAKEYVDELVAKDVTAESIEANLIETENLKADNVEIKENLTANNADIKNLKTDNVEIKENLTANNADIKNLKTDNVEIKENLTANNANINNLIADNVGIKKNLTANNADIKNLKADNVEIKENLTANNADIKNLKSEKLSAKDAELMYANIDFSNIGKAAMEYFYANSGLIKDVVIGDATITGELVGVTISGDLIQGNTIKADKLVVKGGDGLYYKLNIEGGSTVTEQLTEEMLQNGLDGNNIIANTITAEKIAVDDLIAFDATIGGFTIGENSLYSGVKESVDNTTRGIYFDTYGQMNIGDASNFIKYYKDANGKYRLEISAKSVKFGVSGTNLEDELEDVDAGIEEAQSTAEDAQITAGAALESFEVISGYFESLVVDENGESLMEQTGDGWNFNLGPISSKLKDASDDIDVIQNDINTSNANIENLQKSVNKLNELGVYVRISTYENEPCIELGDNSDPTNNFKLIITNKRILFFENGATPTWIANRKLYIETAEVTNELQFGNFAWKVHGTNGNMGLVWKGAD